MCACFKQAASHSLFLVGALRSHVLVISFGRPLPHRRLALWFEQSTVVRARFQLDPGLFRLRTLCSQSIVCVSKHKSRPAKITKVQDGSSVPFDDGGSWCSSSRAMSLSNAVHAGQEPPVMELEQLQATVSALQSTVSVLVKDNAALKHQVAALQDSVGRLLQGAGGEAEQPGAPCAPVPSGASTAPDRGTTTAAPSGPHAAAAHPSTPADTPAPGDTGSSAGTGVGGIAPADESPTQAQQVAKVGSGVAVPGAKRRRTDAGAG